MEFFKLRQGKQAKLQILVAFGKNSGWLGRFNSKFFQIIRRDFLPMGQDGGKSITIPWQQPEEDSNEKNQSVFFFENAIATTIRSVDPAESGRQAERAVQRRSRRARGCRGRRSARPQCGGTGRRASRQGSQGCGSGL